jgi:hypothetical protein
MYKYKLLLFVLASIIFAQYTCAQNNTNSPYTRFGYGDISDTNNGEQRAMGGVAISSRSNTSINTVNPASYSCVDSTTFMFDLGASALISRFSNQTGGKTTMNGNLEYLTMQFPLTKWLGFSAGALPYSFVGYDFNKRDSSYLKESNNQKDTVRYNSYFNGTGGFSQVYMGLSAKFFNHISLGVNAYYIFGTINNYRSLIFDNTTNYTTTSIASTIKANNFRFRFGAQLYNTFNKMHTVNLGVIYEPKIKLNGGFSQVTTGVLNDTIDASHSNYTNYGFELPSMFGIGLNYCYDNKLTIGIDYSLQQWKNAQFFSKTDSLGNRSKLAIGVEYLPNIKGRKYSDRVRYRAGFNMSDSYFNISGQSLPKNFGLSLGVGLPLRNSNTMINASFEYGKIGSTSLLNENYFKFTFNATFNEHWFFKRKL